MSDNKLSYDEASKYAAHIRKNIRSNGRKLSTRIVGGLRRKSDFVKDIDLLVILSDESTYGDISFSNGIQIISQSADGPKKKSFKIMIPAKSNKLIALDIFTCLKSDKPFAMLHHTGGKIFNIKTRVHAKKMGLKLNQYGIFKNDKKISKKFKSERDVLKYLGVEYLTPKKRNL
jgi:DNA polymerase (family 10)